MLGFAVKPSELLHYRFPVLLCDSGTTCEHRSLPIVMPWNTNNDHISASHCGEFCALMLEPSFAFSISHISIPFVINEFGGVDFVSSHLFCV